MDRKSVRKSQVDVSCLMGRYFVDTLHQLFYFALSLGHLLMEQLWHAICVCRIQWLFVAGTLSSSGGMVVAKDDSHQLADVHRWLSGNFFWIQAYDLVT